MSSLLNILNNYSCLSFVRPHTENFIGRNEEIQLLKESLEKKRMKNSILVGPSGCGKTAIIEQLADKVKRKYVILELNVSGSLSNTSLRGEFEQKMNNMMKEIELYNINHKIQIILFIDEIHTLMMTRNDFNSLGANDIIKPYLSKGEITIIGATTPYEYEITIKRDAALRRRLSTIYIEEMSKQDTLKILKNFCDNRLNDYLLNNIYNKSLEIEGGHNPDISLEILDRCMAREKCTKKVITPEMVKEIVNWLKK